MPQLINIYPFRKFGKRIIFHGPRKKKQISLTFDDGPSDQTAELLNILKKNKSKATFFMIGNKISKYRNILKKIQGQGSEIANHTFSHHRCILISKQKLKTEILKADKALGKIGIKTNLFRPIDGRFGPNLVSVLKELDKQAIIWDVEPKDWERPGIKKVVNRILKSVRPGSIICLHDCTREFGMNTDLIKIMKIVIPRLKEMGFELVTVSKLLQEQNS